MTFITKEVVSECFFDDINMLAEVAECFITEYPKFKQDINEVIKKNDYEMAKRQAHKLKGALSNFQVLTLTQMSEQLELLAGQERLDEYEKTFCELTQRIDLLIDELQIICKTKKLS